LKATELIKKHMKSIDLFCFFQSGTEANMAAARLCRVYTGKPKIIKMGGSYHGWYDPFLYSMHIPHSGLMDAQGVPPESFNDLICIDPPHDLGLTEKALKSGDVAAVFIEPLGGESGATPMPPDFPGELRKLCDRYGALLVFDEVVTGFRLGLGGAQEYYGVDADVTILGKLITHGFPSSGGVGGKREIMECFVSGLQPGKGRAFVAGTMRANAITAAASYWTLKYIEENDAIEKAGEAGEKLTAGLTDLFEGMGFPFFAYNFKSIVHFETAAPVACDIREAGMIESALKRKDAVDNLATALLAEGVITKYGNRAFTCMAHSEKDIELTRAAFEKVLRLIPK
jgi:glutamate-1-semialdehyde 2,1-aminomutase